MSARPVRDAKNEWAIADHLSTLAFAPCQASKIVYVKTPVNKECSTPKPNLTTCCSCFDEEVPVSDSVVCPGAAKHAFCLACFENLVKVSGEKMQQVLCSQCKEEGLGAQEFNMQVEGAR